MKDYNSGSDSEGDGEEATNDNRYVVLLLCVRHVQSSLVLECF